MKIKLFLSALALMLTVSSAYASFPVKRTIVTTVDNVTQEVTKNEVIEAVPAANGKKDKWVAAALWLVLGGFAAHRWYIGSPWYWNVLYILTFGFFIVGHIIDIVQILTDSYPGL